MGTKNATTTSTQQLPGYINDAYKSLVSGAQGTGSQPYTPYTGGFTPDQQQAFENIRSMWGSSDPSFMSASNNFAAAGAPAANTMGTYMSPYISQVVDSTMANMQRQNAQQQQQVVGDAISKGAMGGNRVGVAQAELGRTQKLADSQTLANLYQQGFNTSLGAAQADKSAALAAGQGYTGLGQTQMQTGLAQTGAQLGAGTQQQQFDYEQYLNKLAFPYQQQSWLSSIIGGLGSTAGGTTTQKTPQGNTFSQLLGTGLQVASLFSDERMKEDAKVIGRSFDGQPIYAYRYKGSPQTHLGFMAQEVEKKHPEAVGESGGMKTVDYEAATRGAAEKGHFAEGGVVPLDIDLARDPARIMRSNPFGMGFDYDASPRLNPPIRRGDWLDIFRPSERTDLDEMWEPMNGIEREYVRDINRAHGGVVPHMAMGGIPYMNDNGQFGSFMGRSMAVPYANDNSQFGGYIPQAVKIAGGGGNFPTISQPQEQKDPFANPSQSMKDGASNIKGWLTPKVDASKIRMPALFADGGSVGRRGYAGGGVPMFAPGVPLTPEQVRSLYGGIIEPSGGLVGGMAVPEPPPRPVSAKSNFTDTVNVLDADNLGLGVDMTPESTLTPRGEDPYIYPEDAPVRRAPVVVPGGNLTGVVPYGEGEQFVTAPRGGKQYSQNMMEGLQSLFSGKGFNFAPDVNHGLLTAGAAMAASRSPFFLQGVGEGTLAGSQAWKDYQAMERENALARANIGQKGEELAQRAIEIGANAGLTNAQAGQVDTTTATMQWEYKPTMAGMMVIDKLNPSNTQIVPYAQLRGWADRNGIDPATLPGEGNPLTPIITPEGVRFDAQAPDSAMPSSMAMNPDAQSIVIGQTTAALDTSRQADQAAQESTLQLTAMRNAAEHLPATGFLSPGQWAEARGGIAKSLNTLAQIAGIELPFDPMQVASIEEMNKLTTQFGFALARTTGSDVASSVISQGVAAVPSIENTAQGFKAITGLIQAGLNRTRDYHTFLEDWANQTGGDTTGAAAYFNKTWPPSLYANSAIMAAAVVPKTQADIDNAPAGTLFNIDGQLMVK